MNSFYGEKQMLSQLQLEFWWAMVGLMENAMEDKTRQGSKRWNRSISLIYVSTVWFWGSVIFTQNFYSILGSREKQGLQCSETVWRLLVRTTGDEASRKQTGLYSTPVCRRKSDCFTFVFFPVCSWHKTIGKSLMSLCFFRVVSLENLWLCCWEYAVGVFWDERCCASAICCFCCLSIFFFNHWYLHWSY